MPLLALGKSEPEKKAVQNKTKTHGEKHSSSRQAKKDRKKKKTTFPQSMADSIPYKAVYENGIIENTTGTFSKCYELPEINFRLATGQDQSIKAREFGEFLGIFEPTVQLEITVFNRSIDIEEFKQNVLLEMQADGLDSYREEYNAMLMDKMASAKNNLIAKKYLTIAVPAGSIQDAVATFTQIDATVAERLAHLVGKDVVPMTTLERLNLLYDIYNVDADTPLYQKQKIRGHEVESFSLENCFRQGITTKEVIVPSVLNFTGTQVTVGESVAKTYYVANYPSWLKASVLSDFEVLPANYLLSVHFNVMAVEEANKMVKERSMAIRGILLERQKKASYSGYDHSIISPETVEAEKETERLRNDLSKEDERLFVVSTTLTLFAEEKESLSKLEKQAIRIANQNLMTMRPLGSVQQESGFNSSLPLAQNFLAFDRLMQTDSVSAMVPWNMKEVRQEGGRYYGLNAVSKNMILYDRTTGRNSSACILGVPGAGKSFSAKREMVNVLLSTRDEIYCIDPQGENDPIVSAMGGVCQRFTNGRDVYINPLDINLKSGFEDKTPLNVKTDYVMGLCNIIMGSRLGLSPIEKSVITRACNFLYEGFLQYLERSGKDYDYEKNPTLRDLYNILLNQPEPEAQTLALSLERFVNGTYDLFNHHTNMDIENRFVNYNLKNIGAGLEELGLYTAVGYIFNRMMINVTLGIRTWLYVDEFYVLMSNPTAATYISTIWKQARKWDGIPTAITQNVEDMLKSPEARTVINNSDFKILLGQSDINRKQLSDLLSISPMEQKYIRRAKPGMGLLQIGDDFIPFDDNFPRDTELYRLMSTKPQEDFSDVR